MSAGNAIAEIIDKVLTAVGLRQSEKDKLAKKVTGWKGQKKGLADQVEQLKSEIGDLESTVRAKSAELKATKSADASEIIQFEIKDLFEQLDLKKGKREIVFGSMARLNVVIEKAEQSMMAGAGEVSAGDINILEGEYQQVVTSLKDADREIKHLKSVEYKRETTAASSASNAEFERRREQIAGAAVSAEPSTEPAPASASVLSAADRERMARMMENN